MMSGVSYFAAYKALKWQVVHGSLAMRVLMRIFLISIAISSLPLMQLVCDETGLTKLTELYAANDSGGCSNTDLGHLDPDLFLGGVLKPVTPILFPLLRYAQCKDDENLTLAVVRELMGKHLLTHDAKALCVGWGSGSAALTLCRLGFSSVDEVYRRSTFTRKHMQVVHKLHHEDSSFDFVLARDLDKVSVPVLLVSEIERILKPGGVGAVLVGIEGSSPSSLIRSAIPVSSSLKSSNVMRVTSLSGLTFIAFKKRFDSVVSFEQFGLPENCPSIRTNKPFIGHMEPLAEEKPLGENRRITYLPNLVDVSRKRRLVYIDMAAREAANFSNSNSFLPSYPIDSKAFDVFIVDHDALVLSSHVNKPGVTFIYHPGLAGNPSKTNSADVQDIELPIDDDEFDFLAWFIDTVDSADFVVLKMNMGKAELKFLYELFESRAICSVDELFLDCSDMDHESGGMNPTKSCMDMFRSLRSSGVFVHQWWGT
ncbi:hypothetical protein Ancab_014624 [Ancistrocladus abbreviatus]